MEFHDVLHTRRSIRSYEDKPVPRTMIDTILRAAMAAPSAGNQQPWQFVVITDRQKLDRIPDFHPYSKMVTQVSVAILVCGDPEGKKYPAFWDQDVSAATQNMLLAARNLGLGTVWVGVFPDEGRIAGFRTLLHIPAHIVPFALIPIGWPTGNFEIKDRFNPDLVHAESW